MKNTILSDPKFHDEEAAFAFIESLLWPKGPVCPHCGSKERIGKLKGKSYRVGLHKCYVCRKEFTVRIGTIFEDSHIPLKVWLQAIFAMASSKKGISSNQLHRTLGITLKSAWFMSHRIREAMRNGNLAPLGGFHKTVESDETFLWNEPGKKVQAGVGHKNKILSLVDRDSGEVRSVPIENLSRRTIVPILKENIAKESRIMTDDAGQYDYLWLDFNEHWCVCHTKGEYVRLDDPEIHTNTVEGYFSIFKRGMRGVYQHCAKKHLHRYLAEFDFRYSNRIVKGIDDSDRAGKLLKGVAGKRLTYQTTNS
ncbi:MAG: IS1595 family transposase [Syntrophobacteraceae bacterium]